MSSCCSPPGNPHANFAVVKDSGPHRSPIQRPQDFMTPPPPGAGVAGRPHGRSCDHELALHSPPCPNHRPGARLAMTMALLGHWLASRVDPAPESASWRPFLVCRMAPGPNGQRRHVTASQYRTSAGWWPVQVQALAANGLDAAQRSIPAASAAKLRSAARWRRVCFRFYDVAPPRSAATCEKVPPSPSSVAGRPVMPAQRNTADIDIGRIEFDRVAGSARHLGGNESGADPQNGS